MFTTVLTLNDRAIEFVESDTSVEEKSMLFHITQTHTPENCPKETGGSKTLYNPNAEGVKLLAMYGAFAQHVIYYIVEANSADTIHKFLYPGFKSCTATITPVSEEPISG